MALWERLKGDRYSQKWLRARESKRQMGTTDNEKSQMPVLGMRVRTYIEQEQSRLVGHFWQSSVEALSAMTVMSSAMSRLR